MGSAGGGENDDLSACIATDKDGSCCIGGYFQGSADFGAARLSSPQSADAFLAKYDANGQFLSAFQATGSVNMQVFGLAIDPIGQVFCTRYFRYITSFGGFSLVNHGSGRDAFVAGLVSPPLPVLSIMRTGGDALVSWPSGATGFRLESSPENGFGAIWMPVTNTAERLDKRLILTNSIAPQKQFFRLVK